MTFDTCSHERFDVDARVRHFMDIGEFTADFSVRCAGCGLAFKFVEGEIAAPKKTTLRMKLIPDDDLKIIQEGSAN